MLAVLRQEFILLTHKEIGDTQANILIYNAFYSAAVSLKAHIVAGWAFVAPTKKQWVSQTPSQPQSKPSD